VQGIACSPTVLVSSLSVAHPPVVPSALTSDGMVVVAVVEMVRVAVVPLPAVGLPHCSQLQVRMAHMLQAWCQWSALKAAGLNLCPE
jgi:hypothetical protein